MRRRSEVGCGVALEQRRALTVDSASAHDGELIKAMAEGDGDALVVLYDRHGAAVFSLCLRMLRDAEDAEEVLEDAFWGLWQRARQFDPVRGSALAYLVTLARSRAIDRLRTRQRRVQLRSELPESELGENVLGAATVAATPLQEALAFERRARLRLALASLPAPQREAVELSFLEGLSHPEISTRLGEPLGTIKTRIRSGLLRLRDTLRDATGGTG